MLRVLMNKIYKADEGNVNEAENSTKTQKG